MPAPSSKHLFKEFTARLRRERAPRDATSTSGNDWASSREPDAPPRRAQRSFAVLMREFLALLRGRWAVLGVCLASSACVGLLSILLPLKFKLAFDYVILDTPGPSGLPWGLGGLGRGTLLWLVAGASVLLTVLITAIGTWSRYRMTVLTQLLRAQVKRRTFAHLQRLPLHRVHKLKSGGVVSVLREDTTAVSELLFALLYNPVRSVITFVGGLIFMALIDWRLLGGALLLSPAVWLSHRTWIARIRPVFRGVKETRTGGDAHATEVFAGSRIVRSFARQQGELGRFARTSDLMTRQELLAWWWMRLVEGFWFVLGPALSGGAMVYCGHEILAHRMSVGDFTAFTTYLFMLIGPLEAMVNTASTMQTNLAGFDRILDLWHEPTELGGSAHAGLGIPLQRAGVRGRITLERVRFRYPGSGEDVLHDIDLDIAPGETIALIGASGSGKTTLCNLVARFFDPTGGRILLDGQDLRELDVQGYRRLLGIVEQDVFLFDGTVAENIGYARRHAPSEAVIAAARAANADGFIAKLEHGYDTVIGERGVRLSGGQKQRLAIARAILADPRILILDEATSNLDTESEALIQRSLGELMHARTCLVIAHRLSTVRHASRICVLEQGRIVEIGPHAELLARGGRYFQMLRAQIDPHAIGDTEMLGLLSG